MPLGTRAGRTYGRPMHRELEEFRMGHMGLADAAALRHAARPEAFRSGETLMYPGGRREGVLIIETGFAKVCRERHGREVVLAVHGPGELLGEVALLDNGAHSAKVLAITGGTALRLEPREFWALLGERPHLNQVVIGTVTHRLRDAGRQRAEQLTTPSAQRLAARILGLAERFAVVAGDEVVVGVPLSQAELSSWAGVSRETGVRGLRQLRDLGLVRLEHRRIVITDLGGLTQFAGAI